MKAKASVLRLAIEGRSRLLHPRAVEALLLLARGQSTAAAPTAARRPRLAARDSRRAG